MAEYIDRDKLIEQFDCPGGHFVYEGYLDAIISRIKQQSAADVAEVRHGKWIGRPLCGNANCHCSLCGFVENVHANLRGEIIQKYCPNCGAKMDGKDGADK